MKQYSHLYVELAFDKEILGLKFIEQYFTKK